MSEEIAEMVLDLLDLARAVQDPIVPKEPLAKLGACLVDEYAPFEAEARKVLGA